MGAVDLRSFIHLDSLQPQVAAYIGTVARGFLPIASEASLIVEISPGIEINRVTDVAVKATDVRPGCRSSSGSMECSRSTVPLRRTSVARGGDPGRPVTLDRGPDPAAGALLPGDPPCRSPAGATHQPHAARNDARRWRIALHPRVEPAGYAAFIANEAEKAARINVIDVRMTGAFGRVYLGGEQRDIDVAQGAAVLALASITGREASSGRRD